MGTIDLIGTNDLVVTIDLIGPNDLVGPIGSSAFVVPEDLSQRFDVPSFCEDLDFRLFLIFLSGVMVFLLLRDDLVLRQYVARTIQAITQNAYCFATIRPFDVSLRVSTNNDRPCWLLLTFIRCSNITVHYAQW